MRFLALIAGVLLAAAAHAGGLNELQLKSISPGSKWVDSNGRTVSFEQWIGKPVVMTMGYTACRRTCSTSVLVLKELERMLQARGIEAQFVMVSLDPSRDAPKAWQSYQRSRDLLRPNWSFLSGTPLATKRLARFLDVDYWEYHGHILHDFRIVLFDAQGRFAREIDWVRINRLEEALAGL